MKKILLDKIPIDLPKELEPFVLGASVFDSSCHSQAKVYYIDKDNGYYLKISPKGTLETEKMMTEYFYKKGIGAEVLHYSSNEQDYLLTAKVVGDDCTSEKYLAEPKKLTDILGSELRRLHELDFSDCPIKDKMQKYFDTAEGNFHSGNYDKSHFPDSYGYRSAREAYAVFQEGKKFLKNDVLLHGDYCLPNVMLNDWKLSGFIDVGSGGVGDRHVDVFWALWSLGFNLKTDRYRQRFIDVYGRDLIDEQLLKIISAIEVFG